mgnify:CR=1 FL=1
MQSVVVSGYKRVTLYKENKSKTKLVHRLVAEAFLPNPNNLMIVNHKDENKLNNVVTNLEWCTQSYNTTYHYLVADMYHTENGRKYSGEKFDMHKAKEICERYRGILPTSATVADVYVAINSQYHDYAELFKNWFGDGIEQKIVESAIVFWFKDADCKAENKVVEYLGEY